MLKKLHELYDYYYYRISKFYKETSEFYKDSGSDLYCYDANLLIYSAINLIILTLISIVLMLLGVTWNLKWMYAVSVVVVFFGLFSTNKKKYKKLEDKYKNDSHATLKGWLIFLSLIGVFALWMTTCYIMIKVIR